jgi:hypothetical protein
LLFLIIILLTGCDVFEFHPYDGRVSGETNVNARNIEKIEKNCREKASIRFALISDTQRWYDETADFVSRINKHDDIDFVVHAGDISDGEDFWYFEPKKYPTSYYWSSSKMRFHIFAGQRISLEKFTSLYIRSATPLYFA